MPKLDDDFRCFSPVSWRELYEDESTIVVFDTSALLNLYRFPPEVRDALLAEMNRVRTRIWIPFQVAFEFHDNRLSVIANQLNQFRKLINHIESIGKDLAVKIEQVTQYSSSQRESIATLFGDPVEKAKHSLENAISQYPKVPGDDDILKKLNEIIGENVGQCPWNEKDIEDLNKECFKRFEIGIPPGFRDQKEKAGKVRNHGNLSFKKENGDFYLWKQLLLHMSIDENKGRAIVFVCDDEKEDWWLIVNCEGDKKISLLPALRQEAILAGAKDASIVTSNYLYRYLVEREGREVSSADMAGIAAIVEGHASGSMQGPELALHAIANQLDVGRIYRYFLHHGGADIVTMHDGGMTGYAVVYVSVTMIPHLHTLITKASAQLASQVLASDFAQGEVVLVARDDAVLARINAFLEANLFSLPCSVSLGKLTSLGADGMKFELSFSYRK